MAQFKEYPIYKKRDGQSYTYTGYVYADSFKDAKKQFSKNVSKDLYNETWLTFLNSEDFDQKGFESGFYSNETIVSNENDTVNCENSYIECFLTQKAIDKGFDSWSEDVYNWELRKQNNNFKIAFNNETK